MNRIQQKFSELRQKGEKALVGFVTAGDPDIETSIKIIAALCSAGLDILELGVPFSDPTADGPVIQRSSARALAQGVNLHSVLEMARHLRETISIPIILFSYYNPVLQYRTQAFYADALKAGADGVLIVDLPPEEAYEMTNGQREGTFPLIRLVAPTTPPDRMNRIAESASGFLYLISKTGVTGSDGLNLKEVIEKTTSLRAVTDLPICVGFGISTPSDVSSIAAVADGVVIGSAFERLIENNLDHPDIANILAEHVTACKRATRRSEYADRNGKRRNTR